MPSRPLRALLPAALVLSGMGALAVEVLWQRLLSRLLGGSTAGTTAVLAAYMGGLALGAALAGRRGDRLAPARALRIYVYLELAIAASAALTTVVLVSLPAGLSGALAAVPEGTARHAVRLLFATAILLLPTTAMGATLPLAVRASVGASEGKLLGGTGVLYAANTAGAVLGSLLAPLVLMPAVGVFGGALVATAANVLAAGLANRAPVAAADPEPEQTERAPAAPALPGVLPAVLIGAFITGGVALGFEILWTRSLTTQVGSSVHAFGAVLALVLGGIAVGSALVPLAERRRLSPAFLCGLAMALAPILAVSTFVVEEQIPAELARLGQAGHLTYGASLRTLLLFGAGVIVPAALCFGAALPLAIRAARAGASTSRSVGRVYVANTAGAILGTAVTGLILVPWLGRHGSALVLGACGLAAGAAVTFAASRGRLRWASLAVVAAGGLALAAAPGADIFAGAVHERAIRLRGTRGGLSSVSGIRPLYFAEGPEASVAVESDGMLRAFYVAGRPEASNGPRDIRNQYLLGHLPAMLAGGARRSLVVGLGSGMTAGALTLHGEVTIAELNRAVPGATRLFADLNHDVLDKARLRIDDGRVILVEPAAPYDVVTTDPIHPYVAGSALLYTTEHFALTRKRLAPGGMVSLWLPLFTMGPGELRAIIGAFVDVFPDAECYLLSGADALLIGGGGALDDATRLARLRAGMTPAVAADLRVALLETPEEVAALRVAGGAELAKLAAGTRRNTDDAPWIELTLPALKYEDTIPANVRDLMALRTGAAAATPLARVHEKLMAAYIQIRKRRHRQGLAELDGIGAAGLPRTLEVRATARETSSLIAGDDLTAGKKDEAGERALAELRHPEATLRSIYTAARVMQKLGRWDDLERAGGRVLADYPGVPEGDLLRGEALLGLRRWDEAATALAASIAADRYLSYTWYSGTLLGRLQLISGAAEARRTLEASLERRPGQPAVKALLAAAADKAPALAKTQLEGLYPAE